MTLDSHIAAFLAAEPNLAIWRRYPDVTPEQDAFTDSWACETVSKLFAAFLRQRGVPAVLIHAQDAEHGMADYHWWVRVGDVDIDWTARQFHNLEYPALPEHQDLPCPLIWTANGRHPVVGAYANLTEAA